MGVVHWSCIVVENELFWQSCNELHHIYFATHATCLLALTTYKDSELQVFGAIQKLSCKANYKTSFSS
jgi:hypothetical protein